MIVKLLTENDLEFLSLKGGCTGSSESTHVKMPHCWKSHALAQIKQLPSHQYSSKSSKNNNLILPHSELLSRLTNHHIFDNKNK